ncbi:MAG: hypothetical protein HOH33_01815 [Verrucomicrobia bacterium]|nr:hypothetical protein [Verrucomicrobiota bacterium]
MISATIILACQTISFPEVKGKSLQGNEILFPSVFKSQPYHVVMIAFEQEQQLEVNTWLPHLQTLTESRNDLDYFELPTINRMNALMRWIIYRGMRSGIKEDASRKRTVTLHIEKDPFKEALKIESESSIYAFLVDAEGNVMWKWKGLWSVDLWKDLLKSLPPEK